MTFQPNNDLTNVVSPLVELPAKWLWWDTTGPLLITKMNEAVSLGCIDTCVWGDLTLLMCELFGWAVKNGGVETLKQAWSAGYCLSQLINLLNTKRRLL
jgi:hypothetical protein